MYSTFTRDQVVKFVTQYGDQIISGITGSGLFFPTVVAQLTVESKWGQYSTKPASDLAIKYNNWAGIKDSTNTLSGEVVFPTVEGPTGNQYTINATFATYPDFATFIQDYVRILALPKYVNAGVYIAPDPYQQLYSIAKGGYSTNTPDNYLNNGKGRIDACMDNYPWGKISNTGITAAGIGVQTAQPANVMTDINAVIAGALSLTSNLK